MTVANEQPVAGNEHLVADRGPRATTGKSHEEALAAGSNKPMVPTAPNGIEQDSPTL